MNDEQLREIEARLEAATPGLWEWEIRWPYGYLISLRAEESPAVVGSGKGLRVQDALLIAHAPTDIRALLDEVRRLREELTEARCALSGSGAAHEFYEDIIEEVCGGDLG